MTNQKATKVEMEPKVTALVGMSGVMAGVMHAPLTGIFLIAEFTGGYSLFTPLIITATVSYLTIMYDSNYVVIFVNNTI